jgi:hypothetical protein
MTMHQTATAYQTYTTVTTLTNKDTYAAFDAFWLAPFCPAPATGADVQGYAASLKALWRDAVARHTNDPYITETVDCLLAEGVRFERIDWNGLAHSLISESVFA